MTKKKDWCPGFCRTCGTGCGQYCETIATKDAHITELTKAVADDLRVSFKWAKEKVDLLRYVHKLENVAKAAAECLHIAPEGKLWAPHTKLQALQSAILDLDEDGRFDATKMQDRRS